jgi:hypothetical protein
MRRNPTMSETVEERVFKCAAVAYGKKADALTKETLLNDLSPRSVLLLGLVSLLEEEFEVPVAHYELTPDITLGGVAGLIESKLA